MARGLAARERIAQDGSGALYANDSGDEIELYDIVYFPPEGGRYENDKKGEVEVPVKGRDKCVAAVQEWLDESNIAPENFEMVNAPGMAAAVSIWKKNDGSYVAYGRYANAIRPGALGISWSNTQFANETGYKAQSAVSQSENLPLKPSDLFTNEPMTVPQLLTIVNKELPEDLPEELKVAVPALLNAVARGEETYVPDSAQYRSIIEKYVGEYAAAIACITGNFIVGSYDDVEEKVLAPQGADWNDMTLMQFPTSVTAALVDSYILNEEGTARVAISSKARGGGASASLASVARILDEKAETFDDDFLKTNQDLIHGINLLAKNTAVDGVYKTGKLYGFVNDDDIKIIQYMIKSFDKDEKNLTTNLTKIARSYPNKENVQATLMHPNYNLGYRLLAGLARKVTDHLNSLNPTELFRAVLAQSSMCQVYAKTQKKGDALAFTEFKVVFPAVFQGTIVFDATNNYFSTDRPKGRVSFKLKG